MMAQLMGTILFKNNARVGSSLMTGKEQQGSREGQRNFKYEDESEKGRELGESRDDLEWPVSHTA